MTETEVLQPWVCADCRGPLTSLGADRCRCAACGVEFPRVGGVWCLGRSTSEVAAYFDETSAREGSVVETTDYGSLDSFRLRKETFAALVQWQGCRQTLDVGCGGGDFSAEIAGQQTVYGIDLSLNMARRAATKGLICAQASGERLPFPDGTFDLVYCLEAIQYVHEPQPLLAELVRVARPGAAVVVSSLTNSLLREARKLFLPPRLRGVLLTHSPVRLAAHLREAGAEVGEICYLYQPTNKVTRRTGIARSWAAQIASTSFYVAARKHG